MANTHKVESLWQLRISAMLIITCPAFYWSRYNSVTRIIRLSGKFMVAHPGARVMLVVVSNIYSAK